MSSAAGSDNIVPEQLQDEPNQTKDSHEVMTAAEVEDGEFLASDLALAWTDPEDVGEREDATRVQTMVMYAPIIGATLRMRFEVTSTT